MNRGKGGHISSKKTIFFLTLARPMLPEEETVKQAETLVINIPMFEKEQQMSDDSWRQLVAIISSSLSCSYCSCRGVGPCQASKTAAALQRWKSTAESLKGPFLGAALLRRAAGTNLYLSFLIKRHWSLTPGSSNINIITHIWAISGLLSNPFQGPPKVIKAHLMTKYSSWASNLILKTLLYSQLPSYHHLRQS